ncbi:MAG: alkaline phosphatase family protein [Hyphomonadaceae bacterium]
MRFRVAVWIRTLVAFIGALTAPAIAFANEPRLAVIIVVDQMRADYLDRYRSHLHGGLARMMREGVWFQNAWVDHAYTNSLPGHTSIATGSYPRRHGVVDNVWHERVDDTWQVRSGFSLVDRVDGEPYGLGAPTLAEWLGASRPDAIFAAIGTNAAVRLYAGSRRGTVLWLSTEDEAYVTNGNYTSSPEWPEWLMEFNKYQAESRPTEWRSMIPVAVAADLRSDESIFENRGAEIAFPHQLESFEAYVASPFADQATLRLAVNAVQELGLGRDATPDLLMISLEALDSVGHAYGPLSHEQTDAVFRLDENLGVFFDDLDRLVGPGEWMVVLSADHGVAIAVEQRQLDGSAEGRRVTQEEARRLAEAAYAAASSADNPTASARQAILAFDFVDRVYSQTQVAAMSEEANSVEGLLARSYWPGRVPAHPFYIRDLPIAELGLQVILDEHVVVDWATAIHGSHYDYDRRVPFLVLGAGVAPGQRRDRVATVDIAPTVAARIGVTAPGSLDGRDVLR